MRKLDNNDFTNPYRNTHTVFLYQRENSDSFAQFAVRRVFVCQPNEHTQMETQVGTRHKTRTVTQHSSVSMTPAEAREFALQIAPELRDGIELAHTILQQAYVTELPAWLIELAQAVQAKTSST